MTWNDMRIAAGLLFAFAAAIVPHEARSADERTAKPAKAGQEAVATPVRGALPAELQLLKKQGLKVRGDRVVFEGPLSFPPKLKGRTAMSDVKIAVTAEQRPSVRDARQSMRAQALADPRVKAALGERFSLLRSGWLDAEKDAGDRVADRYQLVFYNYAKNAVVTVVASREGKVIDVRSEAARQQPAESREEVDAAIEIVRADKRYAESIKDLQGRGIQTEGSGGDRYLYLLFYREPRTRAVFEATVNMSAGKVVAAQPLR